MNISGLRAWVLVLLMLAVYGVVGDMECDDRERLGLPFVQVARD